MLRRLMKILLSPVTLVTFSLVWPYGVSVFFQKYTLGLGETVGFDKKVAIYVVLCLFSFLLGYTISGGRLTPLSSAGQNVENNSTKDFVGYSGRKKYLFVVSLIFIGISLLIISKTTGLTYGITITTRALEGEASRNLIYGAEGFGFSSTVPGFLRMLVWLAMGSYITWLAVIENRLIWISDKQAAIMLGVSFVPILLAFFITQSRVAILTIILLTIYVLIIREPSEREQLEENKLSKLVKTLFIVVIFLLIAVEFWRLSAKARGLYSNSIFAYADLCMANLTLAVNTSTKWSYGFNTVLSPLRQVVRSLTWQVHFPASNAAWIYNPANCFQGLSYMDFGLFGFLLYFLLGWVIGIIEKKRSRGEGNRLRWSVLYLWAIFALMTLWIVPIFRSAVYWVGVGSSLVLVWVTTKGERRLA